MMRLRFESRHFLLSVRAFTGGYIPIEIIVAIGARSEIARRDGGPHHRLTFGVVGAIKYPPEGGEGKPGAHFYKIVIPSWEDALTALHVPNQSQRSG